MKGSPGWYVLLVVSAVLAALSQFSPWFGPVYSLSIIALVGWYMHQKTDELWREKIVTVISNEVSFQMVVGGVDKAKVLEKVRTKLLEKK